MASLEIRARPADDLVQPSDLQTTWLIARRAAVESLRDRMTVVVSLMWALVVPMLIVLLEIRPQASHGDVAGRGGLGALVTIYLFVVGLMPAGGAIGIASGLFAGEKEQGSLLPLLATPASNQAIFAGKVLGAVLPALLYAGLAELSYLGEIGLLVGTSTFGLLPLVLSLTMVALVPADALLGAVVASLVSSRVRTYQSAQMLTSLALVPIMGALFGLATQMQHWGPLSLVIAVGFIIALDVVLVVLSAATWQREEVMARR